MKPLFGIVLILHLFLVSSVRADDPPSYYVHGSELTESAFEEWLEANHQQSWVQFVESQSSFQNWETLNLGLPSKILAEKIETILRRPILAHERQAWLAVYAKLNPQDQRPKWESLKNNWELSAAEAAPESSPYSIWKPEDGGSDEKPDSCAGFWIIDGTIVAAEDFTNYLESRPNELLSQWTSISNCESPRSLLATTTEMKQKPKEAAISNEEESFDEKWWGQKIQRLDLPSMEAEKSEPHRGDSSSSWWLIPALGAVAICLMQANSAAMTSSLRIDVR